mgnify:CR=1 FL=1
MNPHGAHLHIDLNAIADNWRQLQALGAGAECGAVVKADAYGTGLEQTGPALFQAGCRQFFVAHFGFFVLEIIFFTVNEHHNVGILLDGA